MRTNDFGKMCKENRRTNSIEFNVSCFFVFIILVIFVVKGDAIVRVINISNAVIADSYFLGIPAK